MKIPIPIEAFEDKFPLVPVGEYKAQLCNVVEKPSKLGDSSNLWWEYQLLNYENVKVNHCTSLKAVAFFNIIKMLEALGANKTDLQGKKEFDPLSYVGKTCTVIINHKMVQDKMASYISGFNKN